MEPLIATMGLAEVPGAGDYFALTVGLVWIGISLTYLGILAFARWLIQRKLLSQSSSSAGFLTDALVITLACPGVLAFAIASFLVVSTITYNDRTESPRNEQKLNAHS